MQDQNICIWFIFINILIQVTVYTSEGAYNITVTAINPLGNKTTALDRLFYVQAASHGLKLDKVTYNTKLGDETVIKVNITEGSNVTFDWKLGDQFDVISDAGS